MAGGDSVRDRRIVRSAMVEGVLEMPATVAVPTPMDRPDATRAFFRPGIHSSRKPRAIERNHADPEPPDVATGAATPPHTSRAAMLLPEFNPSTPDQWPRTARDF